MLLLDIIDILLCEIVQKESFLEFVRFDTLEGKNMLEN